MVSGMTIGRSDIDPKASPEKNGDAFYAEDEIAAVFDGIGLSDSPALASRTAALVVQNLWREIFDQKHEILKVEDAMRVLFRKIQDNLWDVDSDAVDSDTDCIATTGIIGKIWRDTQSQVLITIGYLGDSRAYAYRDRNKKVEPLTIDHTPPHTYAAERFFEPHEFRKRLKFQRDIDTAETKEDIIKIFEQYLPKNTTSTEYFEKLARSRNALSRFLGYADRDSTRYDDIPTIYTENVSRGDKYYFTTDGIHGNVHPDELEKIIAAQIDFQLKFHLLIARIAENVSAKKTTYRHYDDATLAVLVPDMTMQP